MKEIKNLSSVVAGDGGETQRASLPVAEIIE